MLPHDLIPVMWLDALRWMGAHWFELICLLALAMIQSRLTLIGQELKKISDRICSK